LEHIYTGTHAADFSSGAKTRVSNPGYQAFQILRLGFVVAPIVAGLDTPEANAPSESGRAPGETMRSNSPAAV
jgi:hypothetical protein